MNKQSSTAAIARERLEAIGEKREARVHVRFWQLVCRKRDEDRLRDMRRRLAHASNMGLLVTSRIDRNKWWWQV